jgi:hypothetical protein
MIRDSFIRFHGMMSFLILVSLDERGGLMAARTAIHTNNNGARLQTVKPPHGIFDDCWAVAKDVFGDQIESSSVHCKDGRCLGIAWKDESRSSVVLGHGNGGVLMTCMQATIFKDVLRATEWPDSFRYNDLLDGEPNRSLAISGGTKTATDGSLVKLFYSETIAKEKRMRVRAHFKKQGSRTSYSLLFDTGSNESFMRKRGDSCKPEHGYHDMKGLASVFKKSLRFGTEGLQHEVDLVKKVDEMISLEGWPENFTFSITMGISEVCRPSVEPGLLGAARGSDFSKSAKTFAYLPSHGSTSEAGSLLIGPQHPWASYCTEARRPVFVNVAKDLSPFHWVVEGSAYVRSTKRTVVKAARINWLVDTGAYDFYVSPDVHASIVGNIHETGSEVVESLVAREFPIVKNCKQNRASFPTVFIRIGRGAESFTHKIKPEEYTTEPSRSSGMCQLLFSQSGMKSMKNTYLIGEKLLRRTLTIFNEEEGVVGFCTPRN